MSTFHYVFLFAELLLFAMAALHCGVSEDIEVIKGNCNDDISLPCKATNRTKTYRYIMWYKTEVSYLYVLTDWLSIIVMVVQFSVFLCIKDFISFFKKESSIQVMVSQQKKHFLCTSVSFDLVVLSNQKTPPQ